MNKSQLGMFYNIRRKNNHVDLFNTMFCELMIEYTCNAKSTSLGRNNN